MGHWRNSAILGGLLAAVFGTAVVRGQTAVTVPLQQFSINGGQPIELDAGTTYVLVLHALDNGAGNGHGFSGVSELGIPQVSNVMVAADVTTPAFTPSASQVGNYPVHCTTICGGGHSGMAGVVVVNPAAPPPPPPPPPPPTTCTPDANTLCLNNNRFEVRVQWTDFQGNSGLGNVVTGVPSTDSGLMWFFNSNNWEMLLKVLNGCGVNGNYWFFSAASTNVQYTITVTDTQSGMTQTYSNPLGTSAPAITDTAAFPSCP